MKNVLQVFVIGLLLAFLFSPLSFGAEFRLKNGDSVSGELMSYDGTTFRAKSKLGILSIEASELAVIGLNTEEGVIDIVLGVPTTDDRDRIKGTIEYVREDGVKIKTDYGYVVVNPLDKATGIFLSEAEAGKARPDTITQPEADQRSVESKGFNFNLQSCKKSGRTVTCNFLFINNDQDKELEIGISGWHTGTPRFFDNLGNEYKVKYVQIGEKNSKQQYVKNLLPTGILIKGSMRFEGVVQEAKMITLLELDCYSGNRFIVRFRNVPFSK